MFLESSLHVVKYLRTKGQQTQPARCLIRKKDAEMSQLKETIARSRSTIAQDFAGAAALVATFIVMLNLPGLL